MRHSVCLGLPGPSFQFSAVRGACFATKNHNLGLTHGGNGWDAFNQCWADAFNFYEGGEITHFAMLHGDVEPEDYWLDRLMDEMERLKADFISVPSAIKDFRGVMSCGIGNPNNHWRPFRRFTIRELIEPEAPTRDEYRSDEHFDVAMREYEAWLQSWTALPDTFNAADAGYPASYLLHNTACWVCDLRNPAWRTADEQGYVYANFDFPRRIVRNTKGKWESEFESEDWYFSRRMAELGITNTYICRKIKLTHYSGTVGFVNDKPWGRYVSGDEDTKLFWAPQEKEPAESAA